MLAQGYVGVRRSQAHVLPPTYIESLFEIIKMDKLTGGCLCGAVRYEANTKPLVTRACWCRTCQYFAAGNATVNVVFPTDAVTISGELNDFESTADSGNKMHRKFCPSCGVHVFSLAEVQPHMLTSSAPKWAYLDPAIPHFEKQPPAPAVK